MTFDPRSGRFENMPTNLVGPSPTPMPTFSLIPRSMAKRIAGHTHTHTPLPGPAFKVRTQYTHVCIHVPAFKARTNLCITHSKWGHFFTHLWTCLARTKRGLRPYPPTPILWQREDSAHSHKARTEILTSLCQNVLTLNVKNWFWSSLWMHTHTQYTHRLGYFSNIDGWCIKFWNRTFYY